MGKNLAKALDSMRENNRWIKEKARAARKERKNRRCMTPKPTKRRNLYNGSSVPRYVVLNGLGLLYTDQKRPGDPRILRGCRSSAVSKVSFYSDGKEARDCPFFDTYADSPSYQGSGARTNRTAYRVDPLRGRGRQTGINKPVSSTATMVQSGKIVSSPIGAGMLRKASPENSLE